MKCCVLTLSIIIAVGSTAFGQVTLNYVTNDDPAPGYKSYTIQATGVGINTLGGFTVTGDVYQVWMAADTQSEWIFNPDNNTPNNPMDSHVLFGNERVADIPVSSPGSAASPVNTTETLNGTGTEGLGTLNNVYIYTPATASGSGPSLIPGDTNGDGDVDPYDICVLASFWHQIVTPGDYSCADFDSDGYVGPADASLLAANWTDSCGCDPDVLGAVETYLETGQTSYYDNADAYLSLGNLSDEITTVDLMQLIVPDGQTVTVELELCTAELGEYGFYSTITSYNFAGATALLVPEPGMLALLGLGALGLLIGRLRRP